jgi:hypothetical protein
VEELETKKKRRREGERERHMINTRLLPRVDEYT